jgi:hypothetical protein
MTIIDRATALIIDVPMGGDMSASRRSTGFFIGNASSVMFEASWPATGTPVGTFALEVFAVPSASSGKAHDAFALAAVVAGQPSGAAGSLRVDNIKTSSAYVCVSYTATSGGTGATPTVTLALKRG